MSEEELWALRMIGLPPEAVPFLYGAVLVMAIFLLLRLLTGWRPWH